MPVASKAWAFFKRDLRTDLSYKISFVFQVADVVVGVRRAFSSWPACWAEAPFGVTSLLLLSWWVLRSMAT